MPQDRNDERTEALHNYLIQTLCRKLFKVAIEVRTQSREENGDPSSWDDKTLILAAISEADALRADLRNDPDLADALKGDCPVSIDDIIQDAVPILAGEQEIDIPALGRRLIPCLLSRIYSYDQDDDLTVVRGLSQISHNLKEVETGWTIFNQNWLMVAEGFQIDGDPFEPLGKDSWKDQLKEALSLSEVDKFYKVYPIGHTRFLDIVAIPDRTNNTQIEKVRSLVIVIAGKCSVSSLDRMAKELKPPLQNFLRLLKHSTTRREHASTNAEDENEDSIAPLIKSSFLTCEVSGRLLHYCLPSSYSSPLQNPHSPPTSPGAKLALTESI